MEPKEIGQILKDLREEKNISARQLAHDLDISLGKLLNIESGLSFNAEDIEIICNYLKVPLDVVMNPKFELKLMENKLDPKEVGERIRYFRNEKKLSLRDLAKENIFSLGKLSNIENGLVAVNIDDIQTICNFLDVPIEYVIDPKRDQRMEDLRLDIFRARTYISLQLFDSAKKVLTQAANETWKENFPELEFYLHYVWGLYYIGIKQYSKAEEHFNQSLHYDKSNKEVEKIKLQILNALTYLAFVQDKINQAMDSARKAIQLISESDFPISIEDKAYTYFNIAVTACYFGHFVASLRYSQTALELAQGNLKNQILFLQGITFSLNGEHEVAHQRTQESIELFRKENDKLGLIKALQFNYYLMKCSPQKYKYNIHSIENEIPNESIAENEFHLYAQLELFQLIIQFAINEANYSLVERLLEKCFEIEKQQPDLKIHYKTYYLAAQFNKKKEQSMSQQKYFLEKALGFLDHDEGSTKALIMFELSLLASEQYDNCPLLVDASNLIFKHYTQDYSELELIKHVVPKPRY